jgi:putative spermidine/putrescine transport system substrate-binding protein
MNALLDPKAQQGFAPNMSYLPTVDDAPLSGQVGQDLALPDPAPNLVVPDYAFDAKIQPEINDWWLKNIQRS